MKKLLLLLWLLPVFSYAQSFMDPYRWYLSPEGQEILISIDDLHDEVVLASPSMNWGRESVPGLTLKKDITIAIIDGGIEVEHPELKDHIAYNEAECFKGTIIPPKNGKDNDQNGYKGDCAGWDFVEDTNRPEDKDGHGSHVTGIMGSVLGGVNGVFKFLPLKVFAPDEGRPGVRVTTPLPVRLTKAFNYALSRNVDVIHLSVGWPKSYMTPELEEVIRKAQARGVFIVAAAGNSSQRATIFPCQLEGVICVGALRPNGEVARFSNWGSQVDIFAPGEKILSTIPHTLPPLHISRKGYDFKNGTSQGAPFISGALAILKGIYPEETSDALFARLMLGAGEIKEGKGLKGLFHIDRSLKLSSRDFVYPVLKGLHSVVLKNNQFELKIPVKNYWKSKHQNTTVSFKCDEAQIKKPRLLLPSLAEGNIKSLHFTGVLNKDVNYLNCELKLDQEIIELKLKVQHKLDQAFKTTVVKQDELLVINTRLGAKSRFSTLNAVKGTLAGPLYYVMHEKKVSLFKEDRILGDLTFPTGCSFLRLWQVDYDQDKNNEIMLETLCDETHLKYQFLNLKLEEIYPAVKYRPTLTVVNYEDFEIIPHRNLPPTFRFVNRGFSPPSDSAWDTNVSSQSNHLYELFPVKDGDHFRFDVRILERPSVWVKTLGLRYLPSYQVLHFIEGELLVKLGQKLAWVNLTDQSARWAGLDHVLLEGSRKQTVLGSSDPILQSFLTPYDYRGFLLNGVKLRFIQQDKFDPLLDVLGTEKNEWGHRTVIRSFQRLIYLQYDHSGNLLEKQESIVDRFDFLTAQDLIASVANLSFEGKLLQLVDGTKINTNYVDLIRDGVLKSFEIPSHCVTHHPVLVDGKLSLPVFCSKSREEFEMQFIQL